MGIQPSENKLTKNEAHYASNGEGSENRQGTKPQVGHAVEISDGRTKEDKHQKTITHKSTEKILHWKLIMYYV